MKKITVTFGLIFLGLSLTAQELQHDSVVVNIEIPVRVFTGDQFIHDLTIDDFEIYEDCMLQKVEAVYLLGKTAIKREEAEMEKEVARKKFAPSVSRKFVLVFEVQDYQPRFEEILDDFFTNVMVPGDTLMVMTPVKTYNLNRLALGNMNPKELARQLKTILRKDIVIGNTEYHKIIKEIIKTLVDDDGLRWNFAYTSMQLENLYNQWLSLKFLHEKDLLNFAEYLRGMDGQKHVFLFYQKEQLPQFKDREMDRMFTFNQDHPHYYQKMYDLFLYYTRNIGFDVDEITKAFSDSSISSHFLYLTNTRPYLLEPDIMKMASPLVHMQEKSEYVFSAFKQVADATGGIVESSANPSYLFKRALETSENYYLLYYTPMNYKSDGKFRNVEIKVKGERYRILHRAGYIAD